MHASFKIETAASLMKNVILLVRNSVCLLKKKLCGRQVKSAHSQLKNNATSTPVLYSPCGKQDIGTEISTLLVTEANCIHIKH